MYSLAILLLRKAKNQGLRIKQNESNDTLYFWAYLVFFSNFFILIATLVSFASETTGLDVKKKKERKQWLINTVQ